MFEGLSFGSLVMLIIIFGAIILVVDTLFKLGRSSPVVTEQNLSKNQNKIFYSIWFWWVFTSVIYFLFNVLGYPGNTSTVLGHVAGFVGLFVPYGAASFVLLLGPFAQISILVFLYLMYVAERDLGKKNYSLLKRILVNLFVLLILTIIVDALRGTFFKSWDIFFSGTLGF